MCPCVVTPRASQPAAVTEAPEPTLSPDVADAFDVADLDALATPYEYRRVRLSFERLGMPSADTQVFHLRNLCGKSIEVTDAAGQPFLKGLGFIQPIGYNIVFTDPNGQLAFTVRTVDLQNQETYQFVGPDHVVIATAARKRFHRRTDIRVCAKASRSGNPVEVECKSLAQHALQAGRYQVSTPEGQPLGTVRRHFRKGVVTHQNYSIVVGPDVDPYLMVFLAAVCNCINNERPKLVWALAAAGLIAVMV
eukprot:EG_transcript_3673